MIKGEIGFIDKNGHLNLEASLFEGIFVEEGNILFGVYYPPKNTPEYKGSLIRHDFMLTPIPFEFWGTVTRLRIRLKHNKYSIEKICAYFKDNQISILNANETRTGYRFTTWNMHVNCDKLIDKELKYDVGSNMFFKTKREITKIVSSIRKEFKDILFIDPNDLVLKNPIEIRYNTALPYFYQTSKDYQRADNVLYSPFSLRCEGNKIYSCTGNGGKLESILYRLNKEDRIYPSLVFAESDTDYLNLRISIIPKEHSKSIFKVTFNFKRLTEPYTSRGLFHYLLTKIPDDYNIWKMYNQTKEMSPLFEEGKITLLIYKSKAIVDLEEEQKKLYKSLDFSNGSKEEEFGNYEVITNIRLINFDNTVKKFNKIMEEDKSMKYDVFISYARENLSQALKIKSKAEAFGLKPFMDVEIQPGEKWEERIKKAIEYSSEFCILYSPICKQKEWVTTEWGAAWFLGKTITTLTLDLTFNDLPDRLKRFQNVRFSDLENYLKIVKKRKDEKF